GSDDSPHVARSDRAGRLSTRSTRDMADGKGPRPTWRVRPTCPPAAHRPGPLRTPHPGGPGPGPGSLGALAATALGPVVAHAGEERGERDGERLRHRPH